MKNNKNSRILFIQPHKAVLTEDIERGSHSKFLAETTDSFARVVPSLPAMTILGALPEYEHHFIDATADEPGNIFKYNDKVSLIGLSDDHLLDEISGINPGAILITSMFTAEYYSANRIISMIKRNFDIPVIVGGHHATLRPEWHLEAGADIIVPGEGETSIKGTIEAIKKGKTANPQKKQDNTRYDLSTDWDIETVLKRKDGSNRYPLSAVTRNHRLYLPEKASPGSSTGVLYASRGCPYSCEYCNATERDGKRIRHMPLEKMISLTEKFISLGANTFHNESDTFGIHPFDKEYLKWAAGERMKDREINLANNNSFFARYFFREGRFLPERADLLRDAGFRTITISIESFNEKYNRGKLKGISIPSIRDCFSYIKQQGLNLDIYMMYLFPGQTEEELKQEIRKAEELSMYADAITWRSLTYFPGTEYYDWAIRTGKFTEQEYKEIINQGISFYHVSDRFNFSRIKNPPKL